MRHRLLLGLVLACLTIAVSAIPASADRFAGWFRNCPTFLCLRMVVCRSLRAVAAIHHGSLGAMGVIG